MLTIINHHKPTRNRSVVLHSCLIRRQILSFDAGGDPSSAFLMANGECQRLATQFLDKAGRRSPSCELCEMNGRFLNPQSSPWLFQYLDDNSGYSHDFRKPPDVFFWGPVGATIKVSPVGLAVRRWEVPWEFGSGGWVMPIGGKPPAKRGMEFWMPQKRVEFNK